jgi:peroxiredoxin
MKQLLIAGLTLCLLGCASQPPPQTLPSPLIGNPMPAFESRTVSGNPVISGGYSGHTVVVSFVDSGCESCERTLRAAQSMYSDQRELVVVSIFADKAPSSSVRSLAARLGLHFPVVVDDGNYIARRFGVSAWPSTFVVDARGRVRWVGGADLTEDGLSRAVASAD